MSLTGILFDFNGTLLFDNEMHMEAFRRTFREYGKPAPTNEFMIRHIFGRTNETIYKENFDPSASWEDVERFAEKKETLYRGFCLENPDAFHLTDGAEEMLNTLKERNIPFCLATGSGMDNLEFYFRHLRLSTWFTEKNIVYTDGTYPGKPAPDIYHIAAQRLGLLPSQCLVFEDGTSGILSANRAGAGAVVTVYEASFPSPLTEETHVGAIFHDFLSWRNILTDYGILR